ncbi:MAG: hypothetical protein AVDCRST_MAG07-2076, partial [uncultured Frankineae bacterium]
DRPGARRRRARGPAGAALARAPRRGARGGRQLPGPGRAVASSAPAGRRRRPSAAAARSAPGRRTRPAPGRPGRRAGPDAAGRRRGAVRSAHGQRQPRPVRAVRDAVGRADPGLAAARAGLGLRQPAADAARRRRRPHRPGTGSRPPPRAGLLAGRRRAAVLRRAGARAPRPRRAAHGRRLPRAVRRGAARRCPVVRCRLVRPRRRVRGVQQPARTALALRPAHRRTARRPVAARRRRRPATRARPRRGRHGPDRLHRLRRAVEDAVLAGRPGPDRLPLRSSRHAGAARHDRARDGAVRRRGGSGRGPRRRAGTAAAGPVRPLPRPDRCRLRHRPLLLAAAARRAGDVDPREQPVRAPRRRPVRHLRPGGRLHRGQPADHRLRAGGGDRPRPRGRRGAGARPCGARVVAPLDGGAGPAGGGHGRVHRGWPGPAAVVV